MYPDGFTYERPTTVEEALSLITEHADVETEFLAGGHSLLPTMKTGLASPEVIIDIGRIKNLRGVETEGDTITIGALTPYTAIEEADSLHESCPVVPEAAAEIGDVQVRNMGTIGGNIAHADPASDMPASILAADATLHLVGKDGVRLVAADDFFKGMFETDLGEEELLTKIEVPTNDGNPASAYVKRPSPASGYAMVGVAAAVRMEGESVVSVRVAATGATDHAVRLDAVEKHLTNETLTRDAIIAASERATNDLDGATLMDNVQGSSKFRAQLLEQYTQRALHRVTDLV